MSEDLVIQHCSPTLAGLKTGSLFSCPCPSEEEVRRDVRALNQVLVPKGLCVLPLRRAGSRALIYLYRPDQLRRDLSRESAHALLGRMGYACLSAERCLVELARRLRQQEGFPHEIGLFLGYPPEDVRGFIEHKGRGCKCVGCWKVYGDPIRAQRRFDQYKTCTETYYRRWSRGASIGGLAVRA